MVNFKTLKMYLNSNLWQKHKPDYYELSYVIHLLTDKRSGKKWLETNYTIKGTIIVMLVLSYSDTTVTDLI